MPTTTINGVSMYYVVRGTGTPIVFVHPPVLSSMSFAHQMDGLANNFKTIAFDLRGHGKSQPSRQALTYPLIVEDIAQLMNHLDVEKAYLCGYSTGGSIVLEFLLTHPERALGGILAGGLSEVNDLPLKRKISMAMAFTKFGAAKALALAVSWSNSDTRELFWATYNQARQGNPQNMEQYYRFSLNYNCTAQLPRIDLPVLLIYGANDTGFHHYGSLLHMGLRRSELIFIRHVKHQVPTKAADDLNRRIEEFVSRHGASGFPPA